MVTNKMAPSLLEKGARLLVARFLAGFINDGCLILLEEGGADYTFGRLTKNCQLKSVLIVHNTQFYWKADLGIADAYINGDFSFVDKDEGLLTFFKIFIVNKEISKPDTEWSGWWSPFYITAGFTATKYFFERVFWKNTIAKSRRNVVRHYDLSNELFGFFLDETMTYTCAIFGDETEDLKTAQLRKIHLQIAKARVKKEHHVLDIGCGWGHLGIEAVKKTGCKYTGITISVEQLKYAEQKAREANLEDRIEIILLDYRDLPKAGRKYDRIFSCEMLESVGHDYIETFFSCCESVLAEDGLFVLQFISIPDQRYDEYRRSAGFIKEYIFQGACMPSLHRVTSAMTSSSKLCVEHVENIGIHYSRTLRRWRQNFLDNESKINDLGFDKKFIRTWEYYFDYCASGFHTRTLGDYQVVFSRPGNCSTLNDPYTVASSTASTPQVAIEKGGVASSFRWPSIGCCPSLDLQKTVLLSDESETDGTFSARERRTRLLVTKFLAGFISDGCLILLEEGGADYTFGKLTKNCQLKSVLIVHNAQFYWKVATQADLGIADAYINGDFSFVDKDEGLLTFFKIFIANKEISKPDTEWRGWWSPLYLTAGFTAARYFFERVFWKNTISQSRRKVARHYDLSNEVFGFFMDETMQYTCAIFENETEDLKTAQLRKIDLQIAKARVKKEHHVLDIGCGWGHLGIEVVKKTGCKYTGITISVEQLKYAEQKAREANLEDRIEILLLDYRDLPKAGRKYDRIFSCEMLESVGHDYIETFFRCCESVLAEDGLFVLQFISIPDQRYDEYRRSAGFIKEYIFQGGCCLPSLHRVTTAMTSSSKLCVEHVENIGIHYYRTLKLWRQNFLDNESKMNDLGFDKKFIRTWEYYFDYVASGFYTRTLGDYQVVFSRPGNCSTLNDPDTVSSSSSSAASTPQVAI